MRKCYGCKREFLAAVYSQMTSTFLLDQSPRAGLQCHAIKNKNRDHSINFNLKRR